MAHICPETETLFPTRNAGSNHPARRGAGCNCTTHNKCSEPQSSCRGRPGEGEVGRGGVGAVAPQSHRRAARVNIVLARAAVVGRRGGGGRRGHAPPPLRGLRRRCIARRAAAAARAGISVPRLCRALAVGAAACVAASAFLYLRAAQSEQVDPPWPGRRDGGGGQDGWAGDARATVAS